MPLTPIPVPQHIVVRTHGGSGVALNRTKYPELARVEGEPVLSAKNPAFDAAAREAFAALSIARKMGAAGTRQRIFLGEPAVHLIYGRAKHDQEKDCDVVGYGLSGKNYAYWLGEGKGDDLLGAVQQFEAVQARLAVRHPDPAQPNDPGPGIVASALIVTNRLRYLEWNATRRRWIAYNGAAELPVVTARLEPNIARARPTLQSDKVYLIDGPEDAQFLPLWAITPGPQPWTLHTHERRGGDRGQFRPVKVGAGLLELFLVS
jgi:hypothetical protein